MGFIQFNEKLVSRRKIGITAKQFWNESRAVRLFKRDSDVVFQFFIKFFTEENQMTFKLSNEWIQSNSELVSWPNTGRIKL